MDKKTIKVSSETYQRLKKYSQDFEDGPSCVIERLINYYEGKGFVNGEKKDEPNQGGFIRLVYRDHRYFQNRLVLQVVKDYVEDHSPISFAELSEVFPANLQGSFGVFNKLEDIPANCMRRRYFTDEEITLSDCEIAVCNQWGRGINIRGFIEHIETELGITIEWSR